MVWRPRLYHQNSTLSVQRSLKIIPILIVCCHPHRTHVTSNVRRCHAVKARSPPLLIYEYAPSRWATRYEMQRRTSSSKPTGSDGEKSKSKLIMTLGTIAAKTPLFIIFRSLFKPLKNTSVKNLNVGYAFKLHLNCSRGLIWASKRQARIIRWANQTPFRESLELK